MAELKDGPRSDPGQQGVEGAGADAMSLMPDADGTVPGSFAGFNSIFLLEK